MTKRICIALFLGISLLFSACTTSDENSIGTNQSESNYYKITAEEAKEMMDAGDVIVVDVRTAEEYDEAHIPGAVLVPNESIGDDFPEALPEKEAVLLVYCRSGNRSQQASKKLAGLGYTQVYDFGGIRDWPYEKESGKTE